MARIASGFLESAIGLSEGCVSFKIYFALFLELQETSRRPDVHPPSLLKLEALFGVGF